MPFSPNRGSQNTIVTISGMSLQTTTGIYLFSGGSRGICNIISTGNSFVTFNPPSTPPGNLRSGQFSVYNLYGSANTTDYYTWIENPFLSGFAPTSGVTGNYIKISGSGILDLTGIYFGDILGTLTSPIIEASTYVRSGIIPFFSGALGRYVDITIMSEAGSSSKGALYIREQGISLSGISEFPVPLIGQNFLRVNSTASALEYRTPNQVLNDITGVLKSGGDSLTGNYRITGGGLYVTGLILHNTGLATGETIFRTTIFSGNYMVLDAIVGGINWRGFSYKFQ